MYFVRLAAQSFVDQVIHHEAVVNHKSLDKIRFTGSAVTRLHILLQRNCGKLQAGDPAFRAIFKGSHILGL